MTGRACAALTLLVVVMACDPCAGTPVCSQRPAASYSGQFIDHNTGAPVGGVVVQYYRTGGLRSDVDSFQTRSTKNGFFRLRLESSTSGEIVGDMHVYPPAPYRAFVVPGVGLRTATRRYRHQRTALHLLYRQHAQACISSSHSSQRLFCATDGTINTAADKRVRDGIIWTHLTGDSLSRIKIVKKLLK